MGNQDLEVQRDRIESSGDIGRQVDREQDDQDLPKRPCWRQHHGKKSTDVIASECLCPRWNGRGSNGTGRPERLHWDLDQSCEQSE